MNESCRPLPSDWDSCAAFTVLYYWMGPLSLLTVGMATLTFFRLTRWAGFGAVAATVSVVALRNAAVILNHAVTIGGERNLVWPHKYSLFLS